MATISHPEIQGFSQGSRGLDDGDYHSHLEIQGFRQGSKGLDDGNQHCPFEYRVY